MTTTMDDVRAAHRDLSATSLEFLDWALENPAGRARALALSAADFPAWMEGINYPRIQAWPQWIDTEKLRKVERATAGVARLIHGIPERIFAGDRRRFAAYYRMPELYTQLLLEPPNGIAGAVGRCDFIDTGRGFQCLEANMVAKLGGWQMRFWAEKLLGTPQIASFLAGRGLEPTLRDPWRELFLHAVRETLPRLSASREMNLLLVALPAEVPMLQQGADHFRQVWSEALRELAPDCDGDVLIGQYPGPLGVQRGNRLLYGGRPVQAVLELTHELSPPEVFRSFKAQAISLFNGPIYRILADKRNLALLSSHADSDRYDAEERRILHDHIPWTRELLPGETVYQGETVQLVELLLAHRERFVVKKGISLRGEDVCVGPRVPAAQWEQAVQESLAEGGWIAQEVLEPRPLLGQHGEAGVSAFDTVWGTYCFGDRYGGCYLRMAPRGEGDGIINAARGAVPGLVFEV